LRRRRRAPDAGQSALADLAGLHPGEVDALERGVGDPRLSAVLDLAAALGVEAAELLEGVRAG
jgi:transcriptional regulator with XRE-family HTH domain